MPREKDEAPDHHIRDLTATQATTASDSNKHHAQAQAASSTVPTWTDAYTAAEQWIRWNGRKRWPQHPVNDEIWSMSIASWTTGGKAAA